MPWPQDLRVLDYRCAAVCIYGNGATNPADMRCDHPRRPDRREPATLTDARALDGYCGPEAALIELRGLGACRGSTKR
jgi:hypothetical protein